MNWSVIKWNSSTRGYCQTILVALGIYFRCACQAGMHILHFMLEFSRWILWENNVIRTFPDWWRRFTHWNWWVGIIKSLWNHCKQCWSWCHVCTLIACWTFFFLSVLSLMQKARFTFPILSKSLSSVWLSTFLSTTKAIFAIGQNLFIYAKGSLGLEPTCMDGKICDERTSCSYEYR